MRGGVRAGQEVDTLGQTAQEGEESEEALEFYRQSAAVYDQLVREGCVDYRAALVGVRLRLGWSRIEDPPDLMIEEGHRPSPSSTSSCGRGEMTSLVNTSQPGLSWPEP